MNPYQDHLPDTSSGTDLPSPLFTPRPGWGGQLKGWFSENAYLVVFRTVLALAVALVVVSIIRNRPVPVAIAPSPTPQSPAVREYAARPGDGMTHLAARAIDEYLAYSGTRLTAEQHLAAVDSLSRSKGWRPLDEGESIPFREDEVAAAIAGSLALSAAALAAWGKYLR